jgi:hypothetical protein
MPRWQNLANLREEKFIEGHSVYASGGCVEFPRYCGQIEGFSSELGRYQGYYPTPIAMEVQAPSLRSDANILHLLATATGTKQSIATFRTMCSVTNDSY